MCVVAAWSLHTYCFQCVKRRRKGIPCEPGSFCGPCALAASTDPDFAQKAQKAKCDRASAARRKSLRSEANKPTDAGTPVV